LLIIEKTTIYAVQSILDYKEIEETDTVKTHNVLKLYCFDTSINTLMQRSY